MNPTRIEDPAAHPGARDVTDELARLLPQLAVALYEAVPHAGRGERPPAHGGLTGRQLEAVVYLSHHRGVTMGEFAAGLRISPAAASELAARLVARGVARRETDARDRRVVRVSVAGEAERHAEAMHDIWQQRIEGVFAHYPDIDPRTLVAFLGDLTRRLKGRSST